LSAKVGARRIAEASNDSAVRSLHEKETVMAKVIRCQCGFLGRGETAAEAATVIEGHMREDHPELVGEVTREDLIAMAEET
jgi:predicted small metal-binding protein